MLLSDWRQKSIFTRSNFLFHGFPIIASIVYASLGSIWIITSDDLLFIASNDFEYYRLLQHYKGWFFVFISALFIYGMLRMAWQGISSGFEDVLMNERRLNLALAMAGGGVWEVNVLGEKIEMDYFSEEFAHRLGFQPGQSVSLADLRSVRHPEDDHRVDAVLRKSIASGGASPMDVHYRMKTKDGEYHWFHSRGNVLTAPDGKPVRVVGVALDVDDQIKTEEQVELLKRYDSATGLPKANYFATLLQQEFESAASSAVIGIVQIRVTGLGHLIAENETIDDMFLLRTLAERVNNREGIIAGRLAPFVFGIASQTAGAPNSTQRVLEEAVKDILNPILAGAERISLRVQIGGALTIAEKGTVPELLRNSMNALDSAEIGNSPVVRWSDEKLNEQFKVRNDRMRNIERAISGGEIICFLQPLIDFKTGYTAGFEALARWNRPEEGLLTPDKFIGLAEDMGIVGQLGEEILRQACKIASTWPSDGPFIAVNVSPLQLADDTFPDVVMRALSDANLQPNRLELEITENALVKDPLESGRRIKRLRDIGVTIAMDDFGTGYSSFSLLSKLPFSRLKIDRSFIWAAQESPDGMALVNAMIELAKNLGLSVTAEGVETAEQAAMLASKGVDIGQGYLFSKPVPEQNIQSMFNRNWTGAEMFRT